MSWAHFKKGDELKIEVDYEKSNLKFCLNESDEIECKLWSATQCFPSFSMKDGAIMVV